MIELLAVADEVGWAYVRCEKDVFLVRPPYTKSSRTLVDDQTVEKAVAFAAQHLEEPLSLDFKKIVAPEKNVQLYKKM